MEPTSDPMPEGIIVNFHIAYTKEVLVAVAGIDRKAAGMLTGRKVFWLMKKAKNIPGLSAGCMGPALL